MTTTATLSELTGDYTIDPGRTRIAFVVRQAVVTKVRGQFDEFEGSAHLNGDDPSKSTAEVTIQANSIQTRNRRRDEHLRSSFLDIPNHPTITFASTKVEQVDETNFKLTGDLTIRGVAKPLTMDFELTGVEKDPSGNFRVGLAAKVTINRKAWGVSWNAALEGRGALVAEKVVLTFDVAAIRQSL
jgi:polyisoprenoid-binding protein YceI